MPLSWALFASLLLAIAGFVVGRSRAYAAAVTGESPGLVDVDTLPSAWFGDVEHTHRAIDDTVGYANLLVELVRRAR